MTVVLEGVSDCPLYGRLIAKGGGSYKDIEEGERQVRNGSVQVKDMMIDSLRMMMMKKKKEKREERRERGDI